MLARLVAVACVAGCGRVRFEPISDAEPCLVYAGCADGEAFSCGTSCYVVCHDPSDQPTHSQLCSAAGMHLATITDATEEACIAAHLTDTPTWYWIGLEQALNQALPTDGWSWVTQEPYAYTNWWDDPMPPPNPDDFDGVEDNYEQCAWKNGPALGFWEDASCDNPNPGVICER
jgi:hypothetical protein